tara:strand:+ start:415 stop:1386 length:972 start_codon:yes stop_codon:yes gene_type:complete
MLPNGQTGIMYTKLRDDTTSIPANSAQTFTFGENIPMGALESIVIRITASVTSNAVLADMGNVFSNLRLTLNGDVFFDFRQAVSGGSNNNPSSIGYFLNSIGGRSVEKVSDTAKEAYFVIPCGLQVEQGVGRIETVLGYAATAEAVASGTFQMWARYNTATQTSTVIAPSTSFTHAAAIEQVVVRIPQLSKGQVVSGILVQNDSAADELGSQGIRIMTQSAYGLDVDFLRTFNGDLYNGVLYADDDLSTTQLSYAQEVAGTIFIPTFNLVGGDVVLQVDSSSATTRTYTPVLVSAYNAKETIGTRQTVSVAGNTSKAILEHVE